MKTVLLMLILLLSYSYASENLVCAVSNTKKIFHGTFKEFNKTEKMIYKIKNDSLFIQDEEKEYFYNTIKEVEYNRYASSYYQLYLMI